MSKYKLTFKLKQHTPIIHFQHDQPGAALRATELKPKLDRFLIEKLDLTTGTGDNERPKDEYKSWFINQGKEHLALDYKVRVEKINTITSPINKNQPFPFYFGNRGKDYFKGKMGLSFYDKDVEVNITCFKNKLLEKLKNNIKEFFELTNFGTRQSKGYGSFTVSKIRENEEWKNVSFNSQLFDFFFKINLNGINFNDFINSFEKAEWFYKALRSGINLKGNPQYIDVVIKGQIEKLVVAPTNLYLKSILFLYLFSRNIQWDKKTVKEKFFNFYPYYKRKTSRREQNNLNKRYVYENGVTKQKAKYPDADVFKDIDKGEKFLWRDLFGLSSNEEWRSYGAKIEKKSANKNNPGNNECLEHSKDDDSRIDRFKSPIFIKTIRNNTNLTFYFKALPVNRDFLNRWFIISKGNRSYDNFCIRTPDNFSFKDLFDWFIKKNNFDFNKEVKYNSNNVRAVKVYGILDNIFKQIQNQPN